MRTVQALIPCRKSIGKDLWTKYGNPEEVLREREMRKTVKYDESARTFFEEYEYFKNGEYTTLDKELIAEYTTNASVLGELVRMKMERKAMMASLNARATDVWEMVLQNSEELRERYHHTLPASLSRLKARICAFQKDGYESVVSKKLGNNQHHKDNSRRTRRVGSIEAQPYTTL